MEVFEFISNVVESVAWPTAGFGMAFIFRKPIIELLLRLRSFQHGETSVDFSGDFAEVENTAREGAVSTAGSQDAVLRAPLSEEISAVFQVIESRIDVDARVAIGMAWEQVEAALRRAGERSGIEPQLFEVHNAIRMAIALSENGKRLKFQTGMIIDNLQSLRNKAIHSSEPPSMNEAVRFIEFSREIVQEAEEL
jgi:hypothetical protein